MSSSSTPLAGGKHNTGPDVVPCRLRCDSPVDGRYETGCSRGSRRALALVGQADLDVCMLGGPDAAQPFWGGGAWVADLPCGNIQANSWVRRVGLGVLGQRELGRNIRIVGSRERTGRFSCRQKKNNWHQLSNSWSWRDVWKVMRRYVRGYFNHRQGCLLLVTGGRHGSAPGLTPVPGGCICELGKRCDDLRRRLV